MLYTATKDTINGRAGALAATLDGTFLRVQQLKAFTDTLSDAQLLAAPFSYAQADIDVLRSALSDLEQLRTIYQGTAALAVAKDFRTFAKQTYALGSV